MRYLEQHLVSVSETRYADDLPQELLSQLLNLLHILHTHEDQAKTCVLCTCLMTDEIVSAELAHNSWAIGACPPPAGEGFMYGQEIGVFCEARSKHQDSRSSYVQYLF